MNPNFHYINGSDKRVGMVVEVYTVLPYPYVQIRRRGKTDKWNVFLFVDQGERRCSGNLLHGKDVTNADPTAAMLEAVNIAKNYLNEKAAALESLSA